MLVNTGPLFSNISKYKQSPTPYVFTSTGPNISPAIGAPVNTSNIYNDVYKKINVSYATWQLSVFNTGVETISGVLTENVAPISNCQMYLYQSSTGVLAQRTISKNDGSFSFTGVVSDVTYFIVGVHKTKKFNSIILDEVRIDSAI